MSSDLETDSNQDSNYSFSDSEVASQATNDSYRTADYDTDESWLLGREGKRFLPPRAAHLVLLLYNILKYFFQVLQTKVVSVYNATTKTKRRQSTNYILFDSDSFPIMVDNGASYSISNDLRDFLTPPTKLGPKIQGFAGSSTASWIGTVEWHIQCDSGLVHTITLPNTSYVPQAELWMLSPQHWAQAANDLRGTMHHIWWLFLVKVGQPEAPENNTYKPKQDQKCWYHNVGTW